MPVNKWLLLTSGVAYILGRTCANVAFSYICVNSDLEMH